MDRSTWLVDTQMMNGGMSESRQTRVESHEVCTVLHVFSGNHTDAAATDKDGRLLSHSDIQSDARTPRADEHHLVIARVSLCENHDDHPIRRHNPIVRRHNPA